MVLSAEGISMTSLCFVFDFNSGHRCRCMNGLGSGSVGKFSSDSFYLPNERANQDHQLVGNVGKV